MVPLSHPHLAIAPNSPAWVTTPHMRGDDDWLLVDEVLQLDLEDVVGGRVESLMP